MRSIRLISLTAVLCCLILVSLQAEIRAIWALPWNINTPEKVDQLILDAVAARQTDIMIEIRYRSDALYQSNRMPDNFPNPEPSSYILQGNGFDALGYALKEAHKRNIRIHAWFVVFNATPTDSLRISQNYIYQNHRDWITYSRKTQKRQALDRYGYFIDPGIPEVQEYLLNVIGDLVSGYPELDGLHFDYVRYPSTDLGYHPISQERYRLAKGATGMSFNQWRQMQVTSFVEDTKALLDSLAPALIFSAAVISDYERAVDDYGQNWQDWLRRDLIDFVYPMAYQSAIRDFDRNLNMVQSMNLNDRIVVGIRAWNDNGRSMSHLGNSSAYSIVDVAARINSIRSQEFAGIALFSYEGLQKDKALAELAAVSFAERTIAALYAKEDSGTKTLSGQFAADVTIIPNSRKYLLNILFPDEGRWQLSIMNDTDKVLYSREGYYLKGMNLDYWNGILEDGVSIASGHYQMSIYRDQDAFEYRIPVQFKALLQ